MLILPPDRLDGLADRTNAATRSRRWRTGSEDDVPVVGTRGIEHLTSALQALRRTKGTAALLSLIEMSIGEERPTCDTR